MFAVLVLLLHLARADQNQDCINDLLADFTDSRDYLVVTPGSSAHFHPNPTFQFVSVDGDHLPRGDNQVYVLDLETITKSRFSRASRSKFIVVTQKPDLESIFRLLWSLNVYQVVVARNSRAYIWYPYSPTITELPHCKFRKTRTGKIPKDLVPNPLKVQVTTFVPFVISSSEGSDIRIVQELAKVLQTDLLIRNSGKPFDFGVFLPDQTVTGVVGEVFYQRVDMGIGGLILQPERYEHLDTSYPYFNERYFWCVPKARRTISWKQVFYSLNLWTWILVLFVFVGLSVVLWLLSSLHGREIFYGKLPNVILNNFAPLVGTSVSALPKTGLVRFYILFWTMVCLILNIVYLTKFMSLMEQGIEEHQTKTMQQLLDSDLEIQMKPSSAFLFGDDSTLQKFIQKGYTKCTDVLSCMEKVTYSRNSSIFVSSSFIGYSKNRFFDDQDSPLMYCFDGGISFSPIFLAMRKNFILKELVDDILKRFFEAGLIELWRKKVFLKRRWLRDSDFQKMNLEFFQAPIFCWIVGMVLAGCGFMGEVLHYTITFRAKPHTGIKNIE